MTDATRTGSQRLEREGGRGQGGASGLVVWTAVGVAMGAGLGVAMNDLALGIGLGIPIGIGIGIASDRVGSSK